jgi:hypothetical protein
MVRNHLNRANVADRNPLKIHGTALLQTFSVVEIRIDGDFGGEETGRAAQKKNENTQGHRSDSYGYTDP